MMITNGYQVLPDLPEVEYEALKADISLYGVLVPVELDEAGAVLDGHHRVKAWQELKAEGMKVPDYPRVVRAGLMTDAEKRSYARRLNLLRRHLSQDQRRELVEAQLKETPERSDRAIARNLGIGNQLVSLTRARLVGGGELCESHSSTGLDGKTRPRVTSIMAKNGRQADRVVTALAELTEDGLREGWNDLRPIEKMAREARLAWEAKSVDWKPPADCELVLGDFREIKVPEESVDLVLTDPPYGEHFLPLWTDLAAWAERVLKPGGFLITLTGQMFVPEVMAALTTKLTYFWLGGLYHPGANLRVWNKRCLQTGKPVLIFSKDESKAKGWWTDFAETERSKEFHDWGQDPKALLKITRGFVQQGDMIVDPFLGGGTSALIARALGCKFIGVEKDLEALKVAKLRLSQSEGNGNENIG